MAEMYLVTLSEASGNHTARQRWMLNEVCNQGEYLGKATCTTMNSTWGEQSTLIAKLVRLYEASGQDFHGLLDMLEGRLKKEEEGIDEETLSRVEADFTQREQMLWNEAMGFEVEWEKNHPDMPLQDMKARLFRPRR